jgi:hypothetical protein
MSAREERRVMLTGGCYCGAVRYETDGEPFHETICHCADCRRIVGAASVAWPHHPSEILAAWNLDVIGGLRL